MTIPFKSGYAAVNGLNMYYEIYGEGSPLVLIHGGGSTIDTSFGRIIPLLSKKRQVIVMELQAHGHTGDRLTGLSFEQDADDVIELMQQLDIRKADILGFSNGGQTAIEIALRSPKKINKLILASAFYKREAVAPGFWDIFENAKIETMPQPLKDGFLKANNNEAALLNMFNRDVERMRSFKGWSVEQMRSISVPVLVINATMDVGTVEHAVEMYRTIPGAELAILPGGHGTYIGTLESVEDGRLPPFNAVPLIESFLDK